MQAASQRSCRMLSRTEKSRRSCAVTAWLSGADPFLRGTATSSIASVLPELPCGARLVSVARSTLFARQWGVRSILFKTSTTAACQRFVDIDCLRNSRAWRTRVAHWRRYSTARRFGRLDLCQRATGRLREIWIALFRTVQPRSRPLPPGGILKSPLAPEFPGARIPAVMKSAVMKSAVVQPPTKTRRSSRSSPSAVETAFSISSS